MEFDELKSQKEYKGKDASHDGEQPSIFDRHYQVIEQRLDGNCCTRCGLGKIFKEFAEKAHDGIFASVWKKQRKLKIQNGFNRRLAVIPRANVIESEPIQV